MPRGNFWEITYDPGGANPTREIKLSESDGSTGYEDSKIVSTPGAPITVRRRIDDPQKRFHKCHFALEISDSRIANWQFYRCTFDGSRWRNVKFSDCLFEECHFSDVWFTRCQFLATCEFIKITASAELLRFESTSISATSFLRALSTNLDYLPDKVTKEYQLYRLNGTREKLAKLLFDSTKSEPDIDFYFQAYKELTIAMLRAKVERRRYTFARSRPARNSPLSFYIESFPARLEFIVVALSGSFSDWGRSLVRPMLFFFCVVSAFTGVYFSFIYRLQPIPFSDQFWRSFMEALNITLVAGYTSFFNSSESLLRQGIEVANLILGLFWYSLIVPTITRKTLR
jgi:hypothetical protein